MWSLVGAIGGVGLRKEVGLLKPEPRRLFHVWGEERVNWTPGSISYKTDVHELFNQLSAIYPVRWPATFLNTIIFVSNHYVLIEPRSNRKLCEHGICYDYVSDQDSNSPLVSSQARPHSSS